VPGWPLGAATHTPLVAAEGEDERAFREGRVLYRLHLLRERSQALVRAVRARALDEHGRLFCGACRFNLAAQYGRLGEGYVECHHTRPVSDTAEAEKTDPADVALVCSNCHRMIHRKRPWPGLGELSTLVARVMPPVLR
jgi:predicted HNH restriction endonuclease